MTTRPIHTTPTMPLNSPRITPGNRDLLNHTPLPNTYRITRPNPTTTLLTALPITPCRIQRHLNGMARRGLRSVSPWLHRHPYQIHPFLHPSVDRNLRPYRHLRLHLHLHPRPSVYMPLPPATVQCRGPTNCRDTQGCRPAFPTQAQAAGERSCRSSASLSVGVVNSARY